MKRQTRQLFFVIGIAAEIILNLFYGSGADEVTETVTFCRLFQSTN